VMYPAGWWLAGMPSKVAPDTPAEVRDPGRRGD
jgi:hypothetical protein